MKGHISPACIPCEPDVEYLLRMWMSSNPCNSGGGSLCRASDFYACVSVAAKSLRHHLRRCISRRSVALVTESAHKSATKTRRGYTRVSNTLPVLLVVCSQLALILACQNGSQQDDIKVNPAQCRFRGVVT